MTLRTGFLLGIAMLVAIQLATAFSAIGLLTRMSPAVGEILAENVYSNEAAEDALSALLLFEGGVEGDHQAGFESALERARKNVTEPGEVPVIDSIDSLGQRVFAGDRDAVQPVVVAARELIHINRQAMQRANSRALRLGSTGAWAAVTLSLVGFLVSALVVRRTIVGVVEPVEELEAALTAFRNGDTFRRCQGRAASTEMRRVLGSINTLLDRANRIAEEERGESRD